MADPLYELLQPHLLRPQEVETALQDGQTEASAKYLSRLLSLRLSDLTTTEPQSLTQTNQSNQVLLQALSSRSHKTTTISASRLSTLRTSLPSISQSVSEIRDAIPALDESAVSFASTYARSRDVENSLLQARKDSMLLSQQSDKLTDILELPSLLSTAIASAGSGAAGSANYSQALDLHAHIRRLSIIYPDSAIVRSVQAEAEEVMKSMATNLLVSLRSQNIRLAAAIRTIGWLRRVVPGLSNQQPQTTTATTTTTATIPSITSTNPAQPVSSEQAQSEGSLGALFLVSRLHTFFTMTEALAPLRDLADQETDRRTSSTTTTTTKPDPSTSTPNLPPQPSRRVSSTHTPSHGTQTERYLKRYIEIFREQSFGTISMYRNTFSSSSSSSSSLTSASPLTPPSALQQFPMHLVDMFAETLRTYLPNVADPAARESLLMQALYAANSLGRLGADFSMVISLLDDGDREDHEEEGEPEWARIVKKHRVQAARLDALSTEQGASGSPVRAVAVADVAAR